MALFQRGAAPDHTEKQVDMSPVIDVDDVSDCHMP
jgi:hypothetical protein